MTHACEMSFAPSRRKLLRRGTAIALTTALGCGSISDPALDPRAVSLQPLPVYARWWSMVESCSGLNGSLSDLTWYQVPGSATVDYGSDEVSAYWSAAGNRIVVAGDATDAGDIVRHEMLHALLRKRGHPREYFLARCGGVVSCASSCVSDAGPAPSVDASTEQVGSDRLQLFVSVIPEHPSSTIDGGVFTLEVSATNTSPNPVLVNFGSVVLSHSFFYTLVGPLGGGLSGSAPILDSSVKYFLAGETKRQYFDFVLGAFLGGRTMPPGDYRVYAGYETRGVTLEGVSIGP